MLWDGGGEAKGVRGDKGWRVAERVLRLGQDFDRKRGQRNC